MLEGARFLEASSFFLRPLPHIRLHAGTRAEVWRLAAV